MKKILIVGLFVSVLVLPNISSAQEESEMMATLNSLSQTLNTLKVQLQDQPSVLSAEISANVGNVLAAASNTISNLKSKISSLVSRKSSIKVITPNGGETWYTGDTYTVSWDSKNAPKGSYVRNIQLIRNSDKTVIVDGIESTSSLATSGSLNWAITPSPESILAPNKTSDQFIIKAKLWQKKNNKEILIASDTSNKYFTISMATTSVATSTILTTTSTPITTTITCPSLTSPSPNYEDECSVKGGKVTALKNQDGCYYYDCVIPTSTATSTIQ